MRNFWPGKQHSVLEGLSAPRIAEWCKVSDRTARRWKAGEEPPHAALQLIELRRTGELGLIDPAWSGWTLKRGRLYGPGDADGASPGDVMSLPWTRRIIATYQRDQRLPRQSDWIAERWTLAREITESTGRR